MKPEKHGRDHCPGGEDPIPCLGVEWGYALFTIDQTVPTGFGSALNTVFDEAYIPSGQKSIVVNPDFTTQPHLPFLCKSGGAYSIAADIAWTDLNWTDPRMIQVLHTQNATRLTLEIKGAGTGQGSALFVGGPSLVLIPGAVGNSPYIEASQTSGSNKTLAGGSLLVVFHGAGSQAFSEIAPVRP